MNRSGTKCLQTRGKVSTVPPPATLFSLPCAGKESAALSVYPVSRWRTKACYGLYIVQKPSQPFHKSFTFFHIQMVYIFHSLLYLHWIKFFILQWLQLKNKHPSIMPLYHVSSFEKESEENTLKFITFALKILGLCKPLWHEVLIGGSVGAKNQ